MVVQYLECGEDDGTSAKLFEKANSANMANIVPTQRPDKANTLTLPVSKPLVHFALDFARVYSLVLYAPV